MLWIQIVIMLFSLMGYMKGYILERIINFFLIKLPQCFSLLIRGRASKKRMFVWIYGHIYFVWH